MPRKGGLVNSSKWQGETRRSRQRGGRAANSRNEFKKGLCHGALFSSVGGMDKEGRAERRC